MKARVIIALLLLLALLGGAALAQGGALNYGDNVVGSLSATSPLAFYTFSGTAGDRVTIQVIGITPGLDPAVSLNSPTQQQLANNDNDPTEPGGTDARITHNLPQNGSYTVLVSSVSGAGGDFLIRLNGQAAVPSTGLTDSPVDAPVGSGAPPQLFSFNANPAAPTSLTITATTPGFGFQAVVRDANGQIVALLTGNTQLSLTLPAGTGTYTVEVTPADPNTTGQVQISAGQPAAAPPPPPAETPEMTAPPADSNTGTSDTCVARAPGPQSVNVRSGPGTDFNIIGQIQPGSMVDVTGFANPWFRVIVPDVGEGWVRNDVVGTFGPCDTVPVVSGAEPPAPAQTEEVAPPAQQQPAQATPTPTATVAQQQDQQQQQQPTATYTPSFTPTTPAQQATATYTPSYTPTTPPAAQVAPEDARFNNPLTIQLDSTGSVTDFVSYPGGDREDRVRWDISGMNNNSSLSGGRARLTLAVSCFGTGIDNVQFFTGGQTYSCGQTIFDQEVTSDSRTGQVTITAVGGEGTYVQWVLTGTAVRVN